MGVVPEANTVTGVNPGFAYEQISIVQGGAVTFRKMVV